MFCNPHVHTLSTIVCYWFNLATRGFAADAAVLFVCDILPFKFSLGSALLYTGHTSSCIEQKLGRLTTKKIGEKEGEAKGGGRGNPHKK